MNAKITAVILAAALGGCGFHLKGNLPQDTLPAMHWRVSGAQLDADLQTALLRAIGSLHRDADAEIRVLDVAEKRDIYTITRGAKLNEYLYSLRVSAQAYRRGKAWGAPIQVDVRRSMSYRDETILGKEHEEALLWQEMRQDAAAQIVRRLAFLPKE